MKSPGYAFWWTVSVLFWAKDFGSLLGLYYAPIAPLPVGVALLRSPDNHGWAAAGIIILFTLVGTIFVAISKRFSWTVLLAHFAVLLYWFIAFALMSPVP